MAHAAVGAEVDVPAYVASTTPPEYRTQCGFSPVGGAVSRLLQRWGTPTFSGLMTPSSSSSVGRRIPAAAASAASHGERGTAEGGRRAMPRTESAECLKPVAADKSAREPPRSTELDLGTGFGRVLPRGSRAAKGDATRAVLSIGLRVSGTSLVPAETCGEMREIFLPLLGA